MTRLRISLPLLAAGLSAVALVGRATPTAGPARVACTPQWRAVAHAGVPRLNSVVAISPTDVWAVGRTGALNRIAAEDRRGSTGVAVHWDGRRVRRYEPFGRVKDRDQWTELVAVAATSTRDVWAVGEHGSETRAGSETRLVIVHWNGSRWRVVPTPNLRGRGFLTGVRAVSADDVWAVGGIYAQGESFPLVMRWNGRGWQRLPTRTVVQEPSYLFDVGGTSSTNVWAVGVTNTDAQTSYAYRELILRWNGSAWTRFASPRALVDQSPRRIDAVSPTQAWTLHSAWGGRDETNLIHWTGRTGRVELTYHDADLLGADAYGLVSEDLAPIAATNVWIVGYRSSRGPDRPVVMHWDGRSVRLVRTAFASIRGATLHSVSAIAPTEIWAVGGRLIARYSC